MEDMKANKTTQLYEDCVNFWHRMGIQKEDNLMALSLADLITAKLASDEDMRMWHAYYKDVAERCIKRMNDPIFDECRGKINCFKNSGL